MAISEHEGWSYEDLLELAKRQKQTLWMILLNLVVFFIPFATLVTGIIQIYFIYMLAKAVRSTVAWVYIIAAFIPVLGLLGLVHINGRAYSKLKANEIRVGFMGAKSVDLEKLRTKAQ
ncbi:MAG: hypothetical protein VCC01_10600 [Candidatus Hydrogenedentota bacterium]